MIPRKIESKIPESAERYPVATLAGTASPGRRPWFGRCFPMFPARRRKTPNTGPSRRRTRGGFWKISESGRG